MVFQVIWPSAHMKIKLRELNILGLKKEFDNIVNIKVRSTGRLLKAKINLLENSANVKIIDKLGFFIGLRIEKNSNKDLLKFKKAFFKAFK